MIASREFTVPPLGETHEVELTVEAAPRRVHGRVLDPAGSPLANASVRVRRVVVVKGHPTRAETGTTTGSDGTFAFEGIYTREPLDVTAHHPRFAPVRQPVPAGDPSDEPLVLQLQEERTVVVRVRDDGDEAVRADPFLVDETELHERPQRFGIGEARFEGLPPGVVTFWCEFSGQRFELRHDTSQPEAVLRVPRPARVCLVPPPEWQPPPQGWCIVLATPLDQQGRAPARFAVPAATGDTKEELMVPGRYRFAIVHEVEDPITKQVQRTQLRGHVDVELRAGELTRVELR